RDRGGRVDGHGLERGGGVGGGAARDGQALGQGASHGHEVQRMVDAVGGDDPVAAVVEDRVPPAVRLGAHHRVVVARRQSGDLEFHLTLVGPEPRDACVLLATAGDRVGRHLGLLDGVVDALEPDPVAFGSPGDRVGQVRAVADGNGDAAGGERGCVHPYAVVAGEADRLGEFGVREAADADQHEVGWHHAAVGELDATDPVSPGDDPTNRGVDDDVDAGGAVMV